MEVKCGHFYNFFPCAIVRNGQSLYSMIRGDALIVTKTLSVTVYTCKYGNMNIYKYTVEHTNIHIQYSRTYKYTYTVQ